MQSKAVTVAAYLASLPADRRAIVAHVRDVILQNLDPDIEERMSYGMIGYAVPHRVFPHGYHCDPAQPLPFAGLAAQKGHLSLYLMGLYLDADDGLVRWFRDAWQKTGRKLDMGKACIRFRSLDDLALDVLAAALRRMTAASYIGTYVAALAKQGKGPDGKKLGKGGANGAAAKAGARPRPAAKKPPKKAPKKAPAPAARKAPRRR